MPIETTIRVPGRSFIHKYQRTSFAIAKVPPVKLGLGFELTQRGKLKNTKIQENPELNADILDNIQPLNKKQYRRRLITSNPRVGQTRVFAYLLSTKDYIIESQIQFRYKWSKQHCRRLTPDDAARPWAKHLYQYRTRHVVRYKFKIDREIEKFSGSTRRWEYDKVLDDPRGWQSQRIEGGWTQYALLKAQLKAAPCVDPGEGENYRKFQPVGTMPSIAIYTI